MDLNHFAAAVISRVLTACRTFQDGDCSAELAAQWQRYDALVDRTITLLHGREEITGIAAGIDTDGSLLLRVNGGAPNASAPAKSRLPKSNKSQVTK